ncbi:MAG: STAS domain-containing protein [Planctomycetota bacterium]
MLSTAKRLSPIGGELELCHLNETVQEVFDISGFSTLLEVYPNEEQALLDF